MLGNNSPLNGGYNTLGENTNYNIYGLTNGVLFAVNNYWGAIPPVSNKIWISNGVIIYNPYLYSDQTGLQKAAPPAGDTTSKREDAALALLTNAMNLAENKNLAAAREAYWDIVNNYSDSYAAFNALSLLTQTYDAAEKETAKLNFKTLYRKSKKKLNAVAGLMLAELDRDNKAKVIEEVISDYKNDEVLEQALFEKFLYYYNDLQDRENAKLVSMQLDKLFPNSLTALDAHYQLGDKEFLSKSYQFAQEGEGNKTDLSSAPTDYVLLNNYPNPFNPSTTISYQIPAKSFVTLKVYDLLGNEVTELVNDWKETGSYTVQFSTSGKQLASGMYFYTLTAGKFTDTKKFILLK